MKEKKFELRDLLPLVQRLQMVSPCVFWLHWCVDSINVTILDGDKYYETFNFYSFQSAEEHLETLKRINDFITQQEERPEV